MGNIGCFEDKSAGMVSLKIRPIDQKTEEEKRAKLEKMTEDDLKRQLYEQVQSIDNYIKGQILPSTTPKEKRSQALQQTFVRWNDLSTIIQYLRQAESRNKFQQQEVKTKKLRQAQSFQMSLVHENKKLKQQIIKASEQSKNINDAYLKFQAQASAQIKQANDSVNAYYTQYQQKTIQLNSQKQRLSKQISETNLLVQKFKSQKDILEQQHNSLKQELLTVKRVLTDLQQTQQKQRSEVIQLQSNKNIKEEQINKLKSQLQIAKHGVEQKVLLDKNYEALHKQWEQFKRQIEVLKEEIQTKQIRISELNRKDEDILNLKNQLTQQVQALDQIKQQISQKQSQIQQMTQNISFLTLQIQSKDDELGSLKQQNGKLHGDAQFQHALQQNNTLKDKIQQMQSKISQLLTQQSNQQNINKQYQSQLTITQQKVKQQQSLLQQQSIKLSKLQKQLQRINEQNNQLKNKKSDLSQQMVNKFVNQIKSLKAQKQELQKEIDDGVNKNIEAVNGMMAQIQTYKTKISNVNNTLNEKNNRVLELELTIEELKSQQITNKQSPSKLNNHVLEMETLRSKINELHGENKNLQQQLKNTSSKQKQSLEKLNSLQNQNLNYQLKLERFNVLVQEVNQKNKQITQKQTQINSLKEQISKLLEQNNKLKSIQPVTTPDVQKLQQQISTLKNQQYFYFLSLTILPLSEIVQEFGQKQQFKEFFKKDLSACKLLYRATERRFESFHQVCDERNDIVVIFKANGKIFGCYSKYGFEANKKEVDQYQQSFIFSLSDGKKFEIKAGKVATTYDINYGPLFGSDIMVNVNKGYSNLGDTFQANIPNPNVQLAGAKQFEIQEYQVYMLWFN